MSQRHECNSLRFLFWLIVYVFFSVYLSCKYGVLQFIHIWIVYFKHFKQPQFTNWYRHIERLELRSYYFLFFIFEHNMKLMRQLVDILDYAIVVALLKIVVIYFFYIWSNFWWFWVVFCIINLMGENRMSAIIDGGVQFSRGSCTRKSEALLCFALKSSSRFFDDRFCRLGESIN